MTVRIAGVGVRVDFDYVGEPVAIRIKIFNRGKAVTIRCIVHAVRIPYRKSVTMAQVATVDRRSDNRGVLRFRGGEVRPKGGSWLGLGDGYDAYSGEE